jgi:hypothetical protein
MVRRGHPTSRYVHPRAGRNTDLRHGQHGSVGANDQSKRHQPAAPYTVPHKPAQSFVCLSPVGLGKAPHRDADSINAEADLP